jgi:hypothetical protein
MAVNGGGSSQQYVAVLLDPWINPNATVMPNLHGLAAVVGWNSAVEVALTAALLIAFLWITRQTDRLELLLALAMVCGLLTSVHSGIPDDVLLFLAFALIFASTGDAPLRAASALVLTPVPYLLVLAGPPYSAALPAALLLLLVVAGTSLVRVRGLSRTLPVAAR